MTFCQQLLPTWIKAISASTSTTSSHQLQEAIYISGTITLFSIDTLRIFFNPDIERALFEPLKALDPPVFLACLPRLYSSFVQSTKKHRTSLVPQSSHGTSDSSIQSLSSINMTFFASCETFLSTLEGTLGVWVARKALLEVVAAQNVFVQTSNPHGPLRGVLDLILRDLKFGLDGASFPMQASPFP
jgi:hypothetical protein